MFICFVFHFYTDSVATLSRFCRDPCYLNRPCSLVTPPFCSLVFVLLAWTVTFEWQNPSIIFLKPPFYSTKPTFCIFLSAKLILLILSLCKTVIFVSKTDIYIYIWYNIYTPYIPYMVPSSVSPPPPSPPMGWVPRYHPPFPSICKLLAAFLRSSFVFARSLQHFWLSASHLLGTCYLLGDLRSLKVPTWRLRTTYSDIYTCAMYLLPIYYLCTLTTLHVFNIYRTYHTFQWCHAYHTYHTYHTYHIYHTYAT